jgi:hypothetical protein
MARPRVAGGEDSLQIWMVPVNILNKQYRTADRGWSSGLVVERVANNSARLRNGAGPRTWTLSIDDLTQGTWA